MADVKQYKNYIDAAFVKATDGQLFESINPYNLQVVGQFARSQQKDVELAVKAAREAFDNGPWPKLSKEERCEYLEAIADGISKRAKDFLEAEMADSGGTLYKVQADVAVTVKVFKYNAKLALKSWDRELGELSRKGQTFNQLVYDPIGVCAQIVPWNFPLMMAAYKVAPALAAGCTVILKPAEDSPLTACLLAEVMDSVGLPKGVFNLLTGYGKEVGEPLVMHPLVDKVSFTGSTAVGKHLMAEAAGTMKRITLECGGKSANIVLPNADKEVTLDGVLFSVFYNSGQCCTAASRLLLPEAEYDAWKSAILERVQSIQLGEPTCPETNLGPVISKKQQQRILGLIEMGKSEGATLLVGGQAPERNGFFVEPTVFENVKPNSTLAQEEIFGPVLCLMKYKTVDEAVAIANNTQYGLAAGVWGPDQNQCQAIAMQLKAGTVWINEYHLVSEKAPFGGYRQSGIGRELGPDALLPYLEVKHIHTDIAPRRDKKFWMDGLLKPKSLANT